MDYAQILFGDKAVHVPAWMYLRDMDKSDDQGTVMLTGASRVAGDHPLRFGLPHYTDRDNRPGYRSDLFVMCEIVLRPHLVVATSAGEGEGASGLLAGYSSSLPVLLGTDDPTATQGPRGEILYHHSALDLEILR